MQPHDTMSPSDQPSSPDEIRRAKQREYEARYRAKHPDRRKASRAAHQAKAKAYRAARYAANREHERAQGAAYRAANRDKVNAGKVAYRAANRDKVKARNAAYYAANREACAATIRAWREANPERRRSNLADKSSRRRARKMGQPTERIARAAVIARDKGICGICGKRVAPAEVSIDHILPLSQGGSHTMHNVQLAHLRCNVLKGAGRIPSQLRLPL